MVDYQLLGHESFDDYLREFKRSILRTTHTYDFFVDWKKVEANAKQHIVEIGLLNSLTLARDGKERMDLLKNLLNEYPKVLNAIPILLAVRDSSLEVAETTGQIIYKRFNFTPPLVKEQVEDMVLFCEKTGIIDLFGKIKDAYSYVFGIEAGLDSNARKNRSGDVFKRLIEQVISRSIQSLSNRGLPLSYKSEVELSRAGIRFPEQKKVDFMVYYGQKPLAVCEVNIYHTQGSKPNEVVRAYIHLDNLVRTNKMAFLWFTDGPGWLNMWRQFEEGASKIEYVLNYTMASKNLTKLLSQLTDGVNI